MDKDVLQYLANLASVRNHASTILNVGRGVIDQKMLHKVSARTSSLDKLFVDVLMGGSIPGQKHNPVLLPQDDDIDIAARLAEAKKEIANKKAKKTTSSSTIESVKDSDDQEVLESSQDEIGVKTPELEEEGEPGNLFSEDEVDAFKVLLDSVETNQKKSLNRPSIKSRRSK